MAQTVQANVVISAKADGFGKVGAQFKALGAQMRVLGARAGIPRVASALGDVGRALGGVARAAAPVLSMLTSIAGLGLAGGIAGLAASLKSSVNALDDMAKQSRQIGLSVQKLREFQYIADLQGVSWDTASHALIKASRNYADLQVGVGRMAKQLTKTHPQLAAQIKSAKNSGDAINIMAGAIHNARTEAEKIRFSELFFGTSDFTKIAELSSAQLKSLRDRAAFLLGAVPDMVAQRMENFNDAFTDVKFAVRGLADAVATELVGEAMPDAIRSMADWVAINRDWLKIKIADSIRALGKWFKQIDWNKIGRGLQKFGEIADKVANILGGWQNVMLAIAAMPFLPLALAIGQLAIMFGRLGAAALPIAAVATASYAAYRAWDKLAPAAERLKKGLMNWNWDDFSSGFLEFDKEFTKSLQETFGMKATGKVMMIGDDIAGLFRRAVEAAGGRLVTIGADIWDSIYLGLKGRMDELAAAFQRYLILKFFPPWMRGDSQIPRSGQTTPRSRRSPRPGGLDSLRAPSGYTPAAFHPGNIMAPNSQIATRGGGAAPGSGLRGPQSTWGAQMGPALKTPLAGSGFSGKAPGIMRQLMADYGLTKEQAAGIVGNLGHESAGFSAMQEKRPLAGRGGWGWAQWTGPRRREFERKAKEWGLDPNSDEMNYRFLKHELDGSERKALAAVRGQKTAQGAMYAFENQFERAGIKGYGSRMKWTNRALDAYGKSAPAIREASSFEPAMRASGEGGITKVEGGKSDVAVRLSLEGGLKASGVKVSSEGNISTGVGIDRTGSRFWRTDAMAH